VFKVLKSRNTYQSQMRNSIKSRKTSTFEGHSLKIESVTRLDRIGSDDELMLAAMRMPTTVVRPGLRRLSKQDMKNSLALQRLADKMYLTLSEATVFNLSFEAVTQYNLCRIVDKGDKEED
jgi:hypothetical protein